MPVVGKTSDEVARRAEFFRAIMDIAIASPSFNTLPIGYHPNVPTVLAEVYFAVSEAYKRLYLKPGSRTERVKVVALSVATVAYVSPLRPQDPAHADREELLYLNPMLAMRVATAIIKHPFEKRTPDDQRRFFRALAELDLPCAAPMIEEANSNGGVLTSNWQIDLAAADRSILNLLVSRFTVLDQMPVYKVKT